MRFRAALVLLLAGCASAPTSEPGPGTRRTVADQAQVGQYVEMHGERRTETTEIDLAPEQAWKRLIDVYRELELPVATLQSAEMRIGNPDFTIRRNIGGLAASRAFDCGRGRAGMLVAEIYPVRVSLHSQLVAAEGGGTRVGSLLTGVAQDAGGSSTNPVRCNSTGALERRIAERLGASGEGRP